MNRNLLLIATAFLIIACNNESNPSPSTSEEPAETTTKQPQELIVESDVPSSIFYLKDENLITDYAEFFLETKIYNTPEEMTAGNGSYYYETIDVKNGFAVVSGTFEGSYTLAVWHMANGEDLVGKTSMGCGPVCDYSFDFYQVRAQLVNDVTSTIVPINEINEHKEKMLTKLNKKHEVDDHNPQLKFVLPQKGTSIEVYLSVDANEYEFPILRLDWNKEEFFIGKKYEEIPS